MTTNLQDDVIITVAQPVINENEIIDCKIYTTAKKSKLIACLATIDIIFNFIYCLFDYYMIIPLIFSFTGYYGAKYYKITYLYIYSGYHIIFASTKVIICIKYTDIYIILINLLTALFEYYIAYLTYKLNTLIESLTPNQYSQLLNLDRYNNVIILS